ncbi:MAG: transglutaminase family protein [Ideonella sp.]|nr:transglutaminase family protein [Ideonella sp.]
MWTIEAFDAAVHRHDATLAARGFTIWVGSEPTFTDRMAQSPPWLNRALGGDKEQRAQALLGGLCRRFAGGLVLRSVGRQYPGEDAPRWNLGLYRRRDGAALWHGPPDPILARRGADRPPELDHWAAALAAAFAARGWAVTPVAMPGTLERRLAMHTCRDAAAPDADDPRLARPSVHAQATPASGLVDELAQAGLHLFSLRIEPCDGQPTALIELPQFEALPLFLAVLACLAQAGRACDLPALILTGYPPPVDATVELTTVTPDPAVVEINTAPSVDAADFLWRSREIYATAADQGLAPYRLYFNGTVADSGGGGQITLGGPSPQHSPFLTEPRLLPRLVRFLNRHPALSYLFSHDFVGSSGQSVRPDERGTDAFDELALALTLLERDPAPTPERLWHSLAPFLCDAAGNSHRAEVNIEKLWNPFLAGRGQLGLVEFRALRMQHTPERATALACLLRGVVAMLACTDDALPLIDWGRELHQRFALPFYLEQDLDAVLKALEAARLGLDEAIRSVLWRESFRRLGQVALPGCTLEVRRGLEFWPLLGDAASPEQGGSFRLVDASTARVELRLRPAPGGAADWRDWQVHAEGVALPMRHEVDRLGELQVFGVRYRSFVPTWGLHPALAAQAPVHLLLRHPRHPLDHRVTLHEWQPDGNAYAGLPEDLAAAGQRRAERVALAVVPRDAGFIPRAAPEHGLGPFCLDLRCLHG